MTDDVKAKHYGWNLQAQTTWAVLILAFLTGLIELLPEVSEHKGNGLIIESNFSSPAIFILYLSLLMCLSYSIYRLARIMCTMKNEANRMSEEDKNEFKKDTPIYLKIVENKYVLWIIMAILILFFMILYFTI